MNAYDFDKTIYRNDSSADFYLFSLKRHPKILKFVPAMIGAFCKFYVFKKGTKTEFKEKVMIFASVIDLEKDINDFWDKKISGIKDFYLRNQKEDDVIISASPRFILEPVCKRLNIKHLICSEVSPETGKFLRLNCHGEEKVKRFYEEFPNASVEEFYSDSKSDTPMAKIAKKAFLVKGDKISNWN